MAIEDFDQVTIAPAKLRPFSKFIMSIGELPTSYLDSMSYAEQVTWFCDYLQNNVIPALNNNAEALEEVQNLMTQLQEYVDNYFTNLDVQEEINNKLDNMAEDGSLTNLIKGYVDPIYQEYETNINNEINLIKNQLLTVANGSPKGVYNTVNDLETANPDHQYIYLVLADGKWYYWSNNAWNAGGIYQGTSVSEADSVIKKINEHIDDIENFEFNWQSGTISGTGNIETGDRNNYYSKIIHNSHLQGKTITIPSDRYLIVAYYNIQGVFTNRSSAMQGTAFTIAPNSSYNARLIIATQERGNNKTINQVLQGFDFDNIELSLPYIHKETIKNNSKLNFINNYEISKVPYKIMHFSVDDTYLCIKDLTNNNYSSIFQNSFLNSLKQLHDNYGMCVTLNTFNTSNNDANYSISNVPTRYQTEFQNNKNWLKFAFHSENENETISDISTSYDTFVTAIYKLTGTYDCIDRYTRLGYFNGSLKDVLTIKNKTYGIKGLLCADTTNRNSYYLSSTENSIVQNKGQYLDLENEIVFLKTITRTPANMITEIENNLHYQVYTEVFMHEYEASIPFEPVIQWALQNGYKFAFPSLINN